MAAPGDSRRFARLQAAVAGAALLAFCFPALAATPTHVRDIRHPPPWPYHWDPVLGTSLNRLLVWLAVSVLAGLAGWVLQRTFRMLPPLPAPVRGTPPDGVGPLQAAVVGSGELPESALTSTVMHQANLGLVSVRRDGDRLVVTGLTEEGAWQIADPASVAFGRHLGVLWPRRSFDLGTAARPKLQAAVLVAAAAGRDWGAANGLLIPPRRVVRAALAVLVLGAAGAFLVFALHLFQPWLFGLPLFAFGLLGAPILAGGAGPRPTAQGLLLRAQVDGFRAALVTPGVEFPRRNDLFQVYLPWALALGCAEEWTDTYLAGGGSIADPAWLEGTSLAAFVTDTELIEQAATGTLEKS